MKKLLSIVLATALLLCSLSVAASAKVYDYEISLDETVTVRATSGNGKSVKFVPEKDMKYVLVAESDGQSTYCDLLSAEGDDWYGSGSYGDTDDFRFEYEFEAGKIYCFNVGIYGADETAIYEFKITLLCGHHFEGDTCTSCGEVCEHDTVHSLGFCPCGAYYSGTELTDGFETEFDKTKDSVWFRFIPEETGLYLFESFSSDDDSDPDCDLYNAKGEWIDCDYDTNGFDFCFYRVFEAGETYHFNVRSSWRGVPLSSNIKFNRVTHTTDDGVEHTDLAFEEEIWSNCTEHGYTEGVYCNTCEEFISGHEELELDKEWHIDDDGDDVCDLCGDDFGCKHICHSDNWFLKIIWAIINFFNSLYDMGMECECGYLHW